MQPKKKTVPLHPDEMLREEYMKPVGLSVNALSKQLRVPATRIRTIVHEKRGITADTAIRPGRYFGTSSKFWIGLQADYDLEVAGMHSARISRARSSPGTLHNKPISSVFDRLQTTLK